MAFYEPLHKPDSRQFIRNSRRKKRRKAENPADFDIDGCGNVCLWYYETRINGRISAGYGAGCPGHE